MSPTTSLVPPRRLGTLLREARVASGLELSALTVASGLTVVDLEDIEYGRRDLDEQTMEALVRAYCIEDAGLVPERSLLIIDLDEGRIAVNHSGLDVDPASGPDAVLARYLALVYRLRDMPLGAQLHLRDVDVSVLSTALELGNNDIESRLHRLMAEESTIEQDQKRIRRQLLLPLVGVLIAATGVGTLVLIAQPDTVPPPAADVAAVDLGAPRIATPAIEEAPTIITDIGNGGAIETNPGS
ncbi:MAG: transcriptional regulator with XRE-family HTH domain [Candidatus Aldehydirespiratoraceae bacterium]|jgi:transcriptional regulator with XRE-family HTH domain